MTIWPIILDSSSACLHGRSLLLVPLGTDTLLGQLRSWLAPITSKAPLVVARADAHAADIETMRAVCPTANIVSDRRGLVDAIAGCELSDVLLIVDPRCLPVDRIEFSALVHHGSANPRVAHQLVALETGISGTKEHVRVDAAGQVRSVLRYYEQATWPFIAGVAAVLLPVSCGVVGDDALPGSLAELRQILAARGVTSRDVPIETGALDLSGERGLLATNEQFVLDATRESRMDADSVALLVGSGHSIHATARIVGPVVIHGDARIDGHVTLIGPTLIGAGAHVQAGAVVAHATIGAGCTVPRGAVVRDRAWFDDAGEGSTDLRGVTPLSYRDRLAGLTVEGPEPDRQKARQRHERVKRLLDVGGATVGLTLLSPLLLVIALLIWLESRGPVFYAQEREGLRGRVFRCWKFRTMSVGAHTTQKELKALDTMDGPHFKLARDPRVTRAGHVLRALNVDELPQLLNVLTGDMSLVGPRPSPFRENQVCVPWREARLSVRPGITGLWQVCRHDRSAGDFHQWIEYDLLYVQHMSIWLDLKILVATVLTLGGKKPVPSSWLAGSRTSEPALSGTVAHPAPSVEQVATT